MDGRPQIFVVARNNINALRYFWTKRHCRRWHSQSSAAACGQSQRLAASRRGLRSAAAVCGLPQRYGTIAMFGSWAQSRSSDCLCWCSSGIVCFDIPFNLNLNKHYAAGFTFIHYCRWIWWLSSPHITAAYSSSWYIIVIFV
jgi:hypothetical protein